MLLTHKRCQWCRHWKFSHISSLAMFGLCYNPSFELPQSIPASFLCDHFDPLDDLTLIDTTGPTEGEPAP